MPHMKPNRRKRPAHSAATTTRKHLLQRVVAIVGVAALAVVGIGTMAYTASAAPRTAGEQVKVADDSTLNNWSNEGDYGFDNTTEHIGRIWTDKTVQTENIEISGSMSESIEIGDSDFLVGLSALSSMSNTMTSSTTPLDIVLVLDMSGSMDNPLGTSTQVTYSPVYANNVRESAAVYEENWWGGGSWSQQRGGEYYALVDGEYVRITERTHTEEHGYGWNNEYDVHDSWNLPDGTVVLPKTNQNDNQQNHVQFYTRRTQTESVSKVEGLKTAVNQFIDATNEQNANLPEDSKHEISIVKFANDKADRIGDDHYWLNAANPNVNYSQVVTDFTDNANALKSVVNDLEPAGATRADYGMEQAQRVLEGDRWSGLGGARTDSKKVVIFFTDGQPTQTDSWSPSVANGAISAAHTMKNSGVTIYSIGVFADADPDNTTDSRFNCYMHAVSSNYPDATGYQAPSMWGGNGNMGERAEDSDFYKAATNSEELNQIFADISEDINDSSGAPTQTVTGSETMSGYITFTDKLGAYMQVDDMNSVVFANTKYTQSDDPTVNHDGSITYHFSGAANSDIYPNGNLDQLRITVTRGATLADGDTVTVQIPASLIPTRYFDVDADAETMDITEAYPIRIFYGVSLKAGVAESIAADAPMGDLTQEEFDALDSYVESHPFTQDGKSYATFLSNDWTSGDHGTTTSNFEPSSGNAFYYYTENTTIYSDPDCTQPVGRRDSIDTNATYYYKKSYWKLTDSTSDAENAAELVETSVELSGTDARNLATGVDADGNRCVPAGTRHTAMIRDLATNKTPQRGNTATANSVVNPSWVGSGSTESINAQLGNNGRLSIELPGTLSVTKNVEVSTGVDASQFADTEFTFNITMADAANGSFKAQIMDAEGNLVQPAEGSEETYFDLAFNANGVSDEFKLRDGDTLTVHGLSDGWAYSVAESALPAGFTQTTPADGAVTGTIDQDNPAEAEFTNTYGFEEDATIPGETDLAGTKTLTPRPWQDGDEFTFEIAVATGSKYADGTDVPEAEQPLPNPSQVKLTNDDANGADGTPVGFHFNNISYNAPGVYNYIIREIGYNYGEEGNIPGVQYAMNRYHVQVTVTDDGKGKLEATSVMRALDENEQPGETVDSADFVNTWNANAATLQIIGDKFLHDSTRPTVSRPDQNKFFFRITAQDGAPLPELAEGSRPVDQGEDYMVVSTLPAGRVLFGAATFDADKVGETFTYTIEEVVKDGDVWKSIEEAIPVGDSGAHVQNGMTYDASTWTLTVEVQSHDETIEPVASYAIDGEVQEGSFVFTNSYDPAPATLVGDAAIHGNKVLSGRDMVAGEAFTFTLEGADTATTTAMNDGTIKFADKDAAESYTQDVTGAKNGAAEGFNFGDVTITKPGTYMFRLSETGYTADDTNYADAQLDSTINGIKFDRHVCTVTVEVEDNNGQLEATVEYSTPNGGSTFTNTYTASEIYGANVDLTMSKTLDGRDMKVREFFFEIAATGENTEAAQAKLEAARVTSPFANPQAASDGVESTWTILKNLEFDQNDAGKTFTYEVKEQIPADAEGNGITYDQSIYEVAIEVVDDADGTMHTVTTVTLTQNAAGEAVTEGGTAFDSSEGTVVPKLSFENTYKANPVTIVDGTEGNYNFYKVVDGRDWLKSDAFNFTIEKVSFNGATDAETLAAMPAPDKTEANLSGADHADAKDGDRIPFGFGEITFDEPGTYVYRVDETNEGTENGLTYDDKTIDFTIVVDDPGTGQLRVVSATATDRGTFTNEYTSTVEYTSAANLSVEKTLNGHAMAEGQFTITMAPKDEESAKKGELWENDEIQSVEIPVNAADDGETAVMNLIPPMEFDQNDSGKTFTYTFKENIPDPAAPGYEYDETTYTVAITPTDNQDGTMTVKTVVTKTPAEGEPVETTYEFNGTGDPADIALAFTNTYGKDAVTDDVSANVTATKTLTGRNMEAGEFNFEIMTADADANDDVECTPESVATGTNAAADNGVAGGIDFEFDPTSAMTYTIEELDQAVTDGYATKVVGDDNNATWTLHYTVKEQTEGMPTSVAPTEDTPTSFDFTVTVTDDGEGKLTAEVTLPEGGIAFKNTYTPTDVTVGDDVTAITVQKTFTGRPGNEWLDTDSFEFAIAADESTPDAPLPNPATVTVTKESAQVEGVDGAFSVIFGDITYNKEMLGDEMTKDFVYIITETAPADSGDGITKDTHTAKVTVTVTDNGEGQLKAEVKYDNEAAKTDADKAVGNAAAFTNTYKAGDATLDGETAFAASKTLTGRDWQDGEQVDIVLAAGANTPKPDGAIDGNTGWSLRYPVSSNGEFGFPDITYSYDVLGGAKSKTFKYYIFEDKTSHEIDGGTGEETDQIRQGMNYSGAMYRIDVTVTDNGEGGLEVTSAMTQEINDAGNKTEASATVAAFENKFSADSVALDLRVQKQYSDSTGGKPLTDGMFTFRVKPVGDNAADAPMNEDPERLEGTGADRYITADLVIAGDTAGASFGTAEFEFDGQNHTFYYEVTEDRPADATEANEYKSAGVTYDPTVYTVVLDVEYDVAAQKTKATMSYYVGAYEDIKDDIADGSAKKANALVFNNSYGTDGATVDSSTTTDATFYKVIEGRDWLDSDKFEFTITPDDGAPAFKDAEGNEVTKVTVTKDNPTVKLTDPEREARSFNFGSVTFTDEDMEGAEVNAETGLLTKKFTYTVKETAGDIAGMTYDGREAKLTITVTDDGEGNMAATPQVSDGVFTNKYATSVDGTAFGGFAIEKTLTGRDMTEGQFEFTVEPGDDASAEKLGITDENGTVPSPAANDGDTVTVHTFGLAESMEFTQADDGKTFTYEVSETKKGGTGYTNDESVYTVSIAVDDDPATATLTVTTTVTDETGATVGEPVVVMNQDAPGDRKTAEVPFVNSYSASTQTEGGTSATVSTTKTLVNRPLEDGEFSFKVSYAKGDKATVVDNVTNTADGTVDFGTFNYTTETLADMVEAGYTEKVTNEDGLPSWTIQYTASEVTDGLPAEGVTASKTSFEFTITVVDNGDGTLTATASLPEGHGFENTYSTNDGEPVSVTPTGNKVFDHAEGLEPNIAALAGEYTFTLEPVTEGAPMPAEGGEVATNDAQGNVTFGAIEFTLDDLNEALAAQEGENTEEGVDTQALDGQPREFTFEYQVTEEETNPGTIDYVTVDTEPKTIKYTVHDDGHGKLTVTSEPAEGPLFTFTNTYTVDPEFSSPTGEGQLTITKTLTGRSMDEGEFSFVLKAVDSDWWTGATNPAAGDGEAATITFGEIEFDAPGIYKYTLQEQAGPNNVGIEYDASVYNVTATVKDTGKGDLEVTWSINGTTDKTIAFENTYTADPTSASFGASKVLTGRDLIEGEFTFQVTDESGEKVYATATNDVNGTVNFEPLTFNQAGTYHLWVSEVLPEDDDAKTDGIQSERVTYDETRYELVVTVEDNRKGNLEVTNIAGDAPVFTNVYTEPEKPVEPQKPVDDGGDKLTGTGDSTMTIVGAVAAAGALFVAGGFVASRKRGE